MDTNSLPHRHIELVQSTIAALRNAELPLVMPGAEELNETRKMLLTQLEARILPRLEAEDMPALVVLGGSSGAGKSTIVNSLLQEEVSAASIMRPTTRIPAVVLHPADAAALDKHMLKDLGTYCVSEAAIPGIVIVDAPDLDTIEQENREISNRLLDAADLWLFVTTAARYGDAVAWNTLQLARQRGITCGVILNRVRPEAIDTISRDLRQRINDLGMEDSPLFIVPDQGAMEGLLPATAVAELQNWLQVVAESKMADSLVQRTTAATFPTLRADLLRLADGLEAQEHALIDLRDKAHEGARAPLEKLVANIEAGRFGQGAPTTAWLAAAATGGPLAGLVALKKPPLILRRYSAKRDLAAQQVFDPVFTSAKLALAQGIVTAQAAIEKSWEKDAVDTSNFVPRARQEIDPEKLVNKALARWQENLQVLGRNCRANAWLSPAGNAALIGAAAGGIVGARRVAAKISLESSVWEARRALAQIVRETLAELVAYYTSVLAEVEVGDSTALRARASEFLAEF